MNQVCKWTTYLSFMIFELHKDVPFMVLFYKKPDDNIRKEGKKNA